MIKKIRKLGILLQENPLLFLVVLLASSMLALVITNFTNHAPLFSNLKNALIFPAYYLAGYIAARVRIRQDLVFFISFALAFIILSIESFLHKSMVNYTSFIVIAFVAMFSAAVTLICTEFFSKNMQSKHKR